MRIYESILWFFAVWTLIEGSLVLIRPSLILNFVGKLMPKWAEVLESMERSQLRSLGGIEVGFGLCLSAYLLWAA